MERVHQVIGDLLGTMTLQEHAFDGMGPWSELLSAVVWVVFCMHYTNLPAIHGQLIFDQDTLLNVHIIADWEANRLTKQHEVDKNKTREK